MSEYGMPYMGSKSKIAASLALNFPKATHFYDLFGGGGAITHYMALRKKKNYRYFHYNEIKSDVAYLFQEAISGKYSYKTFTPLWVSKEDFFKYKDSDAYVRCLWSFGNKQQDYLFSKKIEPYKRSMHMAVVFNEFDDLAKAVLRFDTWPPICKTVTQKRLYLRQLIDHYRKTTILKVLHQFLDTKQLERLQQLQQLEQLERLERLQQLEQLEQLDRLSLSAKDYREVNIKQNSVVYCDIPYKGTADYLHQFNHKDFYDWAISRNFPVYVSEYSLDDNRFKLVYSVDKRSLLASDKSVGNKSEKLFWNGVNL